MEFHFCDKDVNNPTIYSIVMIIYGATFSVLYLGILFSWIRKRNTFPLRERSPFLVFFAVTLSFLSFLIIPLTYSVGFLSSDNEFSPDTDLKNSKLKDYNILIFLRAAIISCQAMVFLPYFLRTLRIAIVFNIKINHPWIILLFSNEGYLVLICYIIWSACLLFSFFLPGCEFSNYFPISASECSIQRESIEVIMILENYTFLISVFLLRNLKKHKEYSLYKETIIIFLIYVSHSAAVQFLTNNYDTIGDICLGPLPLYLILYNLKHIIAMIVITAYPLAISAINTMPLMPTVALEEWRYFLVDEQCFVIFYKYLSEIEQNASGGSPDAFACSFLRFYLDLRIISSSAQGRVSRLKKLFENYFSRDGFSMHFPSYLINELNLKYQSESNFDIDDFSLLMVVSEDKLDRFFQNYKKTHSYKFTADQMKVNDIINDRLFIFNMVSNSESSGI